MLQEKIWKDLKRLQLASLATIAEGGLPWTRYVMIRADRDLVLRCATHLESRKVEQVRQNPEVHLTCGVSDPLKMKPYYQIQGRAEVLDDAAEKKAFWNLTLGNLFSGPDDPNYGIFRIKPYRIELCRLPEMETEVLELG